MLSARLSLQVFAINAMAPFILNSRLKPLMMKGRDLPDTLPVRAAARPPAATHARVVCLG